MSPKKYINYFFYGSRAPDLAEFVQNHGDLLRVVDGNASAPRLLAAGTLRLRPGERPTWVDINLTSAQARDWRGRAHTFGLAVDVWLGVLLEYELVQRALSAIGDDRLTASVASAASTAAADRRIAPTADLRRWVDQLGGSEERRDDDLPSVVIATRLLAQIPHRGREATVVAAASCGHEADAIILDQVAAASGQTLETWAYLAALTAHHR